MRLIFPKDPGRSVPSARAVFRDVALRMRRKIKGKPTKDRVRVGPRPIKKADQANLLLREVIEAGRPALVARLGTTENSVVKFFVEHEKSGACEFPQELKKAIRDLSGFFPPTDDMLSRFSRETLEHLSEVDVLAVRDRTSEWEFWPFEDFFVRNFTPEAQLVALEMLAPIGDPRSWTQYLRGKKVLVIHPFDETIRSQFQKREKIFPDFDFLPSFDLIVIPAVQSVGDNSSHVPYDNWFDALETMKEHIRSTDFDIALIGAGAYGLFLAAECKKLNRPAVQIGGALQLLFGITGKRWLDPASPDSALVLPSVNEHWVAPLESEIPMGANKVEGGCYW